MYPAAEYITCMTTTTWTPSSQPRASDGTFAEKPQSASEVELPPPPGDCDLCGKPIDTSDEFRVNPDNDELYHEGCWETYAQEQEAYWGARVLPRPLFADETDAYEPGDPKAFEL